MVDPNGKKKKHPEDDDEDEEENLDFRDEESYDY